VRYHESQLGGFALGRSYDTKGFTDAVIAEMEPGSAQKMCKVK
jgi:hypothetical protein